MFKNLGIPPPLRSLVVIHPALSSSVSVQLRMRLRLSSQSPSSSASGQRRIHTTSLRLSQSSLSSSPSTPTRTSTESEQADPQEPRLSLTFTCTVTDCDERSTHQFTRRAYERGIVLVTCPKCKNRYVMPWVESRSILWCHLRYLFSKTSYSGPSRMVQRDRGHERWSIEDDRRSCTSKGRSSQAWPARRGRRCRVRWLKSI